MNNYENKSFYKLYVQNPTQENRERLDNQFKKHFYIIRCISYFIKMIHFEARHFDKKQRKRNKIYQLTLDNENDRGQRNIELIAGEHIKSYSKEKLEQVISDPILYSAFLNLTDRQQRILNYIYTDNLQDTEISTVLGISQQAVSKAKKNAIVKLRKRMSK